MHRRQVLSLGEDGQSNSFSFGGIWCLSSRITKTSSCKLHVHCEEISGAASWGALPSMLGREQRIPEQ